MLCRLSNMADSKTGADSDIPFTFCTFLPTLATIYIYLGRAPSLLIKAEKKDPILKRKIKIFICHAKTSSAHLMVTWSEWSFLQGPLNISGL